MLTPLREIYVHWELTLAMAQRELQGKTKGSILGALWLVLSPLVQAGVYAFIIGFVFNTRIGTDADPYRLALYIIGGMAPWQMLNKTISESPMLIRSRLDIVKQVIYPIETLPLTSIMVQAIGPLITLLVWIVFAALVGQLKWSILLLPVPVGMLVALLIGSGWIFSVAGVLVKDLNEFLSLAFYILIFLSPVILSQEMVPDVVWNVIILNPLSHVILCFRDVLEGQFHALSWALFAMLSAITLVVGGFAVSRTKLIINEHI